MNARSKTRTCQTVVGFPGDLEAEIRKDPVINANLSSYVRAAVSHYTGPVFPMRLITRSYGKKNPSYRLPIRLTTGERRSWEKRAGRRAAGKRRRGSLNEVAISALISAVGLPRPDDNKALRTSDGRIDISRVPRTLATRA